MASNNNAMGKLPAQQFALPGMKMESLKSLLPTKITSISEKKIVSPLDKVKNLNQTVGASVKDHLPAILDSMQLYFKNTATLGDHLNIIHTFKVYLTIIILLFF